MTTSNSTDTDCITSKKDSKGRYFWYVVYPSKEWLESNCPQCKYDGRDGYGSAPDDWIQKLIVAGHPFHVSDLHYLDTLPDGRYKKPHWHVIVQWGNNTTLNAVVTQLSWLNSPKPQIISSVIGAYRYARHLDNPEKHQYENPGTAYNGFEVPIDSQRLAQLMREITRMVYLRDCREYGELVCECAAEGPEYSDVVQRHTIYFDRLCTGLRHNPIRNMQRFYRKLDDMDPDKELARELLLKFTEEVYHDSKN